MPKRDATDCGRELTADGAVCMLPRGHKGGCDLSPERVQQLTLATLRSIDTKLHHLVTLANVGQVNLTEIRDRLPKPQTSVPSMHVTVDPSKSSGPAR